MTTRQKDQGWCGSLHTAEDIASARQALTTWAEHTGSTSTAASMAGDIAKRAIDLGLEVAVTRGRAPEGKPL